MGLGRRQGRLLGLGHLVGGRAAHRLYHRPKPSLGVRGHPAATLTALTTALTALTALTAALAALTALAASCAYGSGLSRAHLPPDRRRKRHKLAARR